MLQLFGELLHNGLTALDEPPPSREIITLCIGGGLSRRFTVTLRSAPCTSCRRLCRRSATCACVSTFFGVDEALRVNALPRVSGQEGRART